MSNTKYLLLTAGSVAAIYGLGYVISLNRLSNEIEAVTKASIHKVSLSGIELRINVTLKNPSGGSIKVKQPFVKLLYGTTTLATSQVEDVNIDIPKFSEVNTEPIKVTIGFMTLATNVPSLLKEYRSTGKLTLVVKTVTTINERIPFTKSDSITIGSQA